MVKRIVGMAFAVTAGSLAICSSSYAELPKVSHVGSDASPIASYVVVPNGYETVYLSGGGGGIPLPPGSPPGTTPPDPGNTEAQADRALASIKKKLEDMGMGLGDIVFMKCYLGPDPSTGKNDAAGWNTAFKRYFGTAAQPNKPARTTIGVSFGTGAKNVIEIEAVAVRAPK